MKRLTVISVLILVVMLVMPGHASMLDKISKPSYIGLSIVGTRQDASQMHGSGVGLGGEIFIKYPLKKQFSLDIGAGFMTATDDVFKARFTKAVLLPSLEARVAYEIPNTGSFKPFIYAGMHIYNEEVKYKTATGWSHLNNGYSGSVVIGCGIQWAMTEKGHAVVMSADYRYGAFSSASTKPQYWVGKAGMCFNLNAPKSSRAKKDYYDDLNEFMADESGTKTQSMPQANVENRIEMLEALTKSNATAIEYLKGGNQVSESDREVPVAEATKISPAKIEKFEASYEEALALFRNVKYAEAQAIFDALQSQFPGHKLSSNALYWKGECQFALGQYRAALSSFKGVEAIANSPKQDDSLLKQGLCHSNLGDADAAKTAFNMLLEKFPKSEYVARAKKYLAAL